MITQRPSRLDVRAVTAVEEATTRAVSVQLLDHSEIVELILRPSPWFVLLVGGRFTALMLIVGVVALFAGGGTDLTPTVIGVLGCLAAVARVLVAALQWASSVYILTNRRVMVIKGVWQVTTSECRLPQIGNIRLQADQAQRALRVGTLVIEPHQRRGPPLCWEHITNARDVRERLLRAIQRSRPHRN